MTDNTEPVKRAPRNPPHAPTDAERQQVETMSAYGIPQEEIARVIGIDPKTLRLHYRDELDTGMTKANSRVAQFLFNAASGNAVKLGPNGQPTTSATYADCIRASMFWAKTRMGWRETDRMELTGANGGPMQHEYLEDIDYSVLSDEEAMNLHRIMSKARAGTPALRQDADESGG